jgi:hypothetical protein
VTEHKSDARGVDALRQLLPLSGRATQDRQARETGQADRSQADAFRAELLKQIALLDEQAEGFKAALATHVSRGDRAQVQRTQHDLRLRAVERTKLNRMLYALTRRFPLGQTQPVE